MEAPQDAQRESSALSDAGSLTPRPTHASPLEERPTHAALEEDDQAEGPPISWYTSTTITVHHEHVNHVNNDAAVPDDAANGNVQPLEHIHVEFTDRNRILVQILKQAERNVYDWKLGKAPQDWTLVYGLTKFDEVPAPRRKMRPHVVTAHELGTQQQDGPGNDRGLVRYAKNAPRGEEALPGQPRPRSLAESRFTFSSILHRLHLKKVPDLGPLKDKVRGPSQPPDADRVIILPRPEMRPKELLLFNWCTVTRTMLHQQLKLMRQSIFEYVVHGEPMAIDQGCIFRMGVLMEDFLSLYVRRAVVIMLADPSMPTKVSWAIQRGLDTLQEIRVELERIYDLEDEYWAWYYASLASYQRYHGRG